GRRARRSPSLPRLRAREPQRLELAERAVDVAHGVQPLSRLDEDRGSRRGERREQLRHRGEGPGAPGLELRAQGLQSLDRDRRTLASFLEQLVPFEDLEEELL